MVKASNRFVPIPDYLDTLKLHDSIVAENVKQSILEGTFDFKSENKKLDQILNGVYNSEKMKQQKGNLISDTEVKKMPPAEEYISHLRQNYGLVLKPYDKNKEITLSFPKRNS